MGALASCRAIRSVRPFGLMGGHYEVDADGLRLYRIAWGITVIALLVVITGRHTGVSMEARLLIAAIALLITAGLCVAVARKGTKL